VTPEVKGAIEETQRRIREILGWKNDNLQPWMAERIRMIHDGRAVMIRRHHLDDIATTLELAKGLMCDLAAEFSIGGDEYAAVRLQSVIDEVFPSTER
jgi:hypothetical protein